MKNYSNARFKSLSFLIVCALSVTVSNAQRRGGQNEHRQGNHINQAQVRHEDQSPARFNERTGGPGQVDPGRQNQISNNQPGAGRETVQRNPSSFYHPDRNFRNEHVRVDVRPGYTYYNNSYRQRYRAPVYSAHNPGWRYSYLPARRTVISSFPFGYQTINYGGYGYRYYNGTFYQPYNNAFIVTAPPFGLFLNTLPFGYERIYPGGNPYYYYNGTYYDQFENNYRVVAPPVGAVVESIPQGYETVTIDGETYYKVDGVQYKPVVQDNGEIWYQVIKTG